MSKFEEYDLYAGNKSFLPSEKVITFTDTDGKLLALKPDVTLSIIKNYRPSDGTEKVYYHENVYRSSDQGFREIEQAGLECLGGVDEYSVCEVLALATKTLLQLSKSAELDISHLGILCELLDGLSETAKKSAVEFIGCKNSGELSKLLDSEDVPAETSERIIALSGIDCPAKEASERLRELLGGYVSWERLQLFCDTCDFLGEEFPGAVRVDFSAVGDLNYYSGIVFRGYISGLSQSVLSGGQYDQLMKRLKKPGRAIGFALYLDLLEPLIASKNGCDFDALLIYDVSSGARSVYDAAKALEAEGKTVITLSERPENITFKEIYRVGKDGAVKIE